MDSDNIEISCEDNVNNSFNSEIDNKTLKEYKKEFKILKKSYDDKEKLAKKVVKKRFEPPQLTYDKFINSIDNCHKIFYNELNNAYSIIELKKDDSKVKEELDNKIKVLNLIIQQIDDLSDELIITFGSAESNEELDGLLKDIEDLIASVKKYN